MKKTTAPNGYRTVLVLNTFERNDPVLVDADGRFDSDLVTVFGQNTEVYDSCSVTFRNKEPDVTELCTSKS